MLEATTGLLLNIRPVRCRKAIGMVRGSNLERLGAPDDPLHEAVGVGRPVNYRSPGAIEFS